MKGRLRKAARKSIAPYRSKFEHDIAENLSSKGVRFEYEPHKVAFSRKAYRAECMDCGSTNIGTSSMYLPDFLIANGIYIEAKGRFTSKDRTKTLDILASNNDITRENFRMLFMQDKHTTASKRMRYTDWCNKHNIICAVGTEVPEEWVK
jgi:hypothetical protein